MKKIAVFLVFAGVALLVGGGTSRAAHVKDGFNKTMGSAKVVVLARMGAGAGNSSVQGGFGPAPNSGDCSPDGSGFDAPNGPNGVGSTDAGHGHMGPAPNSGDGDPDGSGFDAPNGPYGK